MKPAELTGQRFGRLTILQRVENDRFGKTQWEARCDCGKLTRTRANTLLKGETLSCGCLFQEKRALGSKRTHGQARTPLYRVWSSMKGRCLNPTDQAYPNYGGRGITVCLRWRESFEAFVEDMGLKPSSRHTVGRQDNNGPYSPENCRWETQTQQARNTRRTFSVTFRGETLTLGGWAEKTGIPESALYFRLRTSGWSVKDTLTTPSTPPKGEQHPGHKLTDRQVDEVRKRAGTTSQVVLAKEYGVSQAHISRLLRGRLRNRTISETPV